MTTERLDAVVRYAKAHSSKPVVLFPGSVDQVHGEADALLLLSVISGRNPELLIGQHVVAAPRIKALGLETISTGYMLVDSGRTTTALYMSQTLPIPAHKPEIAAATALAGEMLGIQAMYLDGGSGAREPVPEAMIRAVRKAVNVPVIVGGGIRSEAAAQAAWDAGADVVVVGTAFEEDPFAPVRHCSGLQKPLTPVRQSAGGQSSNVRFRSRTRWSNRRCNCVRLAGSRSSLRCGLQRCSRRCSRCCCTPDPTCCGPKRSTPAA